MKRARNGGNAKRALGIAVCGVVAAGLTVGAFARWGEQEAESITVSAGLQQYADGAYLACSAPVGESISFTAQWFDNTLQGGAVSSITVTSLPPVTEGRLLLGQSEVTLGQVISRETVGYLSFSPNEGVRESHFEFVPATASGSCGYVRYR